MLTITPDAMNILRRVTSTPTMAATSGVRIAQRSDPSAPMQVRAVERPSPGDRVLEQDGARLYLAPEAASHVEGRRLDADTDEAGRVQFILKEAS